MLTNINILKLAVKSFSINSKRFASSSRNQVAVVNIESRLADDFKRKLDLFYGDIIKNNDYSIKPITEKEVYLGFKELLQSIRDFDPNLIDRLEEAKERNPILTVFNGFKAPEFSIDLIPNSKADFNNSLMQKMLRPHEILATSLSLLSGVMPDDHFQDTIVSYIFSSEGQKNNRKSFLSGSGIDYHNDGWRSSEAMPYLCLFGVRGDKNLSTQIISYEDIERYFISSGKENLLNALNQDFTIDDGFDENYFGQKVRIIDRENAKINYAAWADILPRNAEEDKALSFLRQALQQIQPITVTMDKGLFVKIANSHSLHSSKLNGDATEVKDRLVIRTLGVDASIEDLKFSADQKLSIRQASTTKLQDKESEKKR